MNNAEQQGKTMRWTNGTGSDVVSGQVVVIGSILGVAIGAIADGAEGVVAVEGVFNNIPKVSAAVFGKGEKLIFDVSANSGVGAFDDKEATTAAGDIVGGAIAWEAGADAEVFCKIKLTPGNTDIGT